MAIAASMMVSRNRAIRPVVHPAPGDRGKPCHGGKGLVHVARVVSHVDIGTGRAPPPGLGARPDLILEPGDDGTFDLGGVVSEHDAPADQHPEERRQCRDQGAGE